MSWQHIPGRAWKDNPFPMLAAFLSLLQVSVLTALDDDGTRAARFVALMLALGMFAFILIANRYLPNYLITIAGRRPEGDHDEHIPAAIFQCGALFFAIINFYGALFYAQMGWRYPCCAHAGDSVRAMTETAHWAYYSAVTITTLGYGDIAPISTISQLTAGLEAVNGLLAFGVFTGAITTYLSRQ
ncbi:MAG: ion channel [Rhizomicrobium sp.]